MPTNVAVPVRFVVPATALGAAGLAMVVSAAFPLLGPLLLAFALGAFVANTPWAWSGQLAQRANATKNILRWGVVLLGLRVSGVDLLGVGASGLGVIVATVALTYSSTLWFGRRMRMDRGLVTLVAAGFSICGAAAIAAVNDVVRAQQRYVGLAIALVTIYGSAMIVGLPALATALGLSDRQAAVWAGASIHEVAQVIAAASIIGPSVVAIAMTIKLGRVMLLAPVCIAASREFHTPGPKAPMVPWFVGAFAVAVAVRSTGLLSDQVLGVAGFTTTLFLSAGMFGMGLGIRFVDLWPVPASALALATLATLTAAASSLTLVTLFVA